MSTTQDRYEQQQSQLRGDSDIRIEAPRSPEINPDILKDVDPMLFRGFLNVSAEINGVSFVFKSLNHHEFAHLALMSGVESGQDIRHFHNLFLSFGVLMIDGVSVLQDRDQWLYEIAGTFDTLSEGARQKVIRYLSELNRRASRAVALVEVYCLEAKSRLRWAQYQNLDLTSPAVTGFAGTQNLGLNWAQLTWRAVNNYEDLCEAYDRDWENTKFIAGAFVGSKGLATVNSKDKQRREQERGEKLSRRDRIIREVVLGETHAEKSSSGLVVKAARTVEELASQLEKDLRGDKDWHDSVVESHLQKAEESRASRIQQLQEIREAHVAKYGDRAIIGGVETLEGLTREQADARLRERVSRVNSIPGVPKDLVDPKAAQFREKLLNGRR